VLLRKGGIEEPTGTFRVEHPRFWLYPTYVHQQRAGIKPEAAPLLDRAEADRPPAGTVRLSHFAEVAAVCQAHDRAAALAVDPLHLWSAATIEGRFAYRRPGLNVLAVRVYRAADVTELNEKPEYAGCRSWVDLGKELPTDGATPVLTDSAFRDVLRALDALFQPTAPA
jgi:hypothetical protein